MAWAKIGGSTGPIQKWTATGQQIEGIFLGLRDGKEFRAGQGKSKLADIKKDDGTQVTCGAPTALAGQLSQVKPGSRIKITFLGLTRGQGGVEYKNFDTEVYVPEGTVSSAPTVATTAAPAPAPPPPAAPSAGEFERLTALLQAAKGKDAAEAIAGAIKSMEGDPVERLKKTMQAQGIAF